MTANPNAAQQKKTKLIQLRPLLGQIGIDSVGVFCASESWEIWDRIKAIAKFTEIANQKEKDIRLLNWVFGVGGGLSMSDRPLSEVL